MQHKTAPGKLNMISFWEMKATRQPLSQRKEEAAKYDADTVKYSAMFPELEPDRLEEALKLFKEHDKDGNHTLNKREFCALLRSSIPGGYASGDLFERIAELAFDSFDKDHSGSVSKEEFLASYKDMFCNERKQMALLLSKDFPGLSLPQLEKALETLEKFDKDGDSSFGVEEFYQLKEAMAPMLSEALKKMSVEDLFSKLDKDGSGELSPTELLHAYHAFTHQVETIVPKAEPAQPSPRRQAPPSQQGGAAPSATPRSDANAIFEEFLASDDVVTTLSLYGELKACAGVGPDQWGLGAYDAVKAKVNSRKASVLWQLLDVRRKQPEYRNSTQQKARVLIVGSGPGGLRGAVEMALLGAHVTVLEKRPQFTRNNLLHVWDSSIRDLRNIGAKFFYPQFAIGGINHIAIRRLQTLLLKVILLLGVKYLTGVTFKSANQVAAHSIGGTAYHWKADVDLTSPPTGPFLPSLQEDDLWCNVLLGADGENSSVARLFHFELKLLQGSRALGITANFVNQGSQQEKNLKEFGLLSVYSQAFFSELNSKHGIDLENLVYYRGETHYFVMTAKTQSLVGKGVCKQAFDNANELLSQTNLSKDKLAAFVREVADYVELPSSCPFATNPVTSAIDVAIFDFSKKHQSTSPFNVVGDGGVDKQLLVLLVGDALVEPFWPLGTGCNRAILAALDAAWMVKGFFEKPQTREAQGKQWQATFKILSSSSPSDLVPNFGLHTIDPSSRYAKNATHFH